MRLAPGTSADVLVPIHSWLPAYGVQGQLHVTFPFDITGVAYGGDAGDVHVTWSKDRRITRFTITADTATVVRPGASDLLRVTVSMPPYWARAMYGSLSGQVEVALDPHGGELPLCALPADAPPPLTICTDPPPASCDVNLDGRADVRDLVLRAQCFTHSLSLEDSVRICTDCDGSGAFDTSDLYCCTRHILTLPLVTPDTSEIAPGVELFFTEPQAMGGAWLVRLLVSGADALGGAMLRLRYPAERWTTEIPITIDQRSSLSSTSWAPFVDPSQPGVVHLGGLRLGAGYSSELEFTFYLMPTEPVRDGDRLIVEGADLVMPDGRVLGTTRPLPQLVLRAPPPPPPWAPSDVEFSVPFPNPFTRETSFRLGLPRETAVRLTVLDVAGRRVATIADQVLPAGWRLLSWNPGTVRDGLYFVRLEVDGRVWTTRAALVRDRR